MSDILGESLELNSMEAILAVSQFEGEYKRRIEGVKEACTDIFRTYKKRERQIADNADKYQQDKVADLLFNLRKATRQTLEELVRGRSFLAEIEACRQELEKDEPRNDIQQLTQTMREIELRGVFRDAGADFPNIFMAEIIEGDPLTIDAILNAPVPLPVDEGLLEDGKKRRLEILKPVLAKRLAALQQAQGTIEGLAETVMPIKKDDIDPIRDILEETYTDSQGAG
ncbi:MAG: hypothetical protein H8E17_16475 [Deltaproteobacteria bacterium]|nr:hypothetical protein [Deltaproteobacteria bacterium]MBL7204562.1 hypothetical protein [Desulfobacteraceae bacterium]